MIESLALALSGFGLAASIVYYANILNNANKTRELQLKAQEQALETRQAQMFLTIYNRMLDEKFSKNVNEVLMKWEWSDWDDFLEKYGPDTDIHDTFNLVMMFYEGIGILINKGLIKASLIDDFLSAAIVIVWEKYGPIVYQLREYYGAPQTFEWVEYLYNQIKPIVEEQHKEK
jgi:hypothetical protein